MFDFILIHLWFLISVESKDSSKLFFTYPNVSSSVCPGFYANTKLNGNPRKGDIFKAKLDGNDYPCTVIENTVTCYIDHQMYDGERFGNISIVSTNSSKTIAKKGEFRLDLVGNTIFSWCIFKIPSCNIYICILFLILLKIKI